MVSKLKSRLLQLNEFPFPSYIFLLFLALSSKTVHIQSLNGWKVGLAEGAQAQHGSSQDKWLNYCDVSKQVISFACHCSLPQAHYRSLLQHSL